MRKILCLVGAFVLLAMLLFPVVVLAAYAHPDIAGPSILSIDIYNNYLEPDDMLVVAKYRISYTTEPALSANELYIGRILDPSLTELGVASPYAYYNDGYDYGFFAIYFDTASAPTWAAVDTVNIGGNPLETWSPTTPPTGSLSTISWHSTSTVAATSSLLSANVLSWADSLGTQWSVSLVSTTPAGAKLTTYGDQYFSTVIPSLRTACPLIYSASTQTIEITEPTSYNTPDADTLDSSWPWQTSSSMKLLMIVAIAGIMIYVVGILFGRVDIAIGLVLLTVPLGARIGIVSTGTVLAIVVICCLIIGFSLIIQRGAT